MSQAAYDLLRKLLKSADKNNQDSPVLPISKTRAPEYFTEHNFSTLKAIHAVLQNAQAQGAVTLEWGKYEAENDLRRIRLADAERLAAFLGVERAGDKAARLANALEPILQDAPAWLRDVFSQALEKWQQGENALGYGADETDRLCKLFRAAIAVARNEQQNLDLRRFSARCVGDSKFIENNQGGLVKLLRADPANAELQNLDSKELFEALGLQKFTPPLFIKGPLAVSYSGERLDLSAALPYLALSPDCVDSIRLVRPPPYVLNIENLASYQRHIREITDDAIVLYTGGFPAPAFRMFLARLEKATPASIRFFHWGDIDLGGLRIFDCLARCLSRPLQAHQMVLPEISGGLFSHQEIRQLEKYRRFQNTTGKLAANWLEYEQGRLEQENVEPRPCSTVVI
jgi:hypothetical protein